MKFCLVLELFVIIVQYDKYQPSAMLGEAATTEITKAQLMGAVAKMTEKFYAHSLDGREHEGTVPGGLYLLHPVYFIK